jgi:uridine phosphorylase
MSDAQPITGLRPGQVPKHVFLCGDPARVERIARGWEEPRELVRVREFRIIAGRDRGLPLAAASTGVGAPGAAIVMEELVKVGAHTFLRIGNSGGLAPDLALGDLVVTTGPSMTTGIPRWRGPRVPGRRRMRRPGARRRSSAGITVPTPHAHAVLRPDGPGPMSAGSTPPERSGERAPVR